VFGSTVIDLVIAMALIFLVFSLITSGLRELIAKVLETRAKELWRTLRRLLDDPLAGDLRELRALAKELDAASREDGQSLGSLIDAADSLLRSPEPLPIKAKAWRAYVKSALAPIRTFVPNKFDAIVVRTERRLWLRQPGGSRSVLGALRAGRRGGDRPLIPEIPTPATPAALAADVRSGAKTLTDALNEHPLIRQIDTTWDGYLSRMTRLESGDFSGAMLDIVRSVGLEPALSSAFEQVMRQLDELYPEESSTDLLWQPIGAGLGDIVDKFEGGIATPADVASAVAKIRAGIEGVISDLGDIADDDRALLLEHFESAERSLEGFAKDPMQLIRRGAELLNESAPVKDALLRLTAGVATDAVKGMVNLRGGLESWYDSRMDALSGWYRRRTRLVSFALGLVVVIGFNIDAIDIPQELWRNDQVREMVVAGAADAQGLISSCLEIGNETDGSRVDCVESRVDQLIETGLPLGWRVGTSCDGDCDSVWEGFTYAVGVGGEGWRGAFIKPVGWLLAAAAMSLGASFWFDILRRASGLKKARQEN